MGLPILLVDDEQPSLEALKGFLSFEFDVVCAGPDNPVPTALRLWRERPDLAIAIVDLNMPDLEGGTPTVQAGLNLISQLKKIRSSARVAARSAFETHENLADAAKNDADGFQGKDWEAADIQANVNFMATWVTVGATLRALSHGIDFRIPRTAGHDERVRNLCRALVIHLEGANPKTFDLAACLLSAELHDLGKLGIPDEILLGYSDQPHHELLEQHTEFASALRHLGPGFDKVERIIALHHRSFQPAENCVLEYPQRDDLPRGDAIPLEARVLRLADAVDNLLTNVPTYDLATTLEIVRENTAHGIFDPKVVRALEDLAGNDLERLHRIYPPQGLITQTELLLYYWGERMTAGQLQASLAFLANFYLPTGRASDRMTITGVDTSTFAGRTAIRIRLCGSDSDIGVLQKLLESHCQQRSVDRPKAQAHLVDHIGWAPIPDGWE
jgi:response regulator RpfG family c-di-GMP phosphodiesterase